MADKACCPVGLHPLVEDINDLLQSNSQYGDIRTHLIESGEAPVEKYELSRHSLRCLKLPRRGAGRPKKESPTGEAVPTTKQVRDLAISLFYDRMKSDPESIKSSELAQFVTAALRIEAKDGSGEGDDADAILEQLGGTVKQ